jgi:hypothetical protein
LVKLAFMQANRCKRVKRAQLNVGDLVTQGHYLFDKMSRLGGMALIQGDDGQIRTGSDDVLQVIGRTCSR